MGQAISSLKRMSEPETHAAETYPLGGAVSDARLVEDVRKGDQEAFEHLVRRYEGRLLSVLLRFVRDRELARDLSQETFLRVYERLDQFDPARRFGPWLFRIGVNLALDFIRKRKRRVWPSLFSDSRAERAPDPAVADPRVALDLEQEVRRVLDAIPEKYRSVLILRDLENFSTSEIAAIMHRKEATIRWRLAEARLRFEHIWTRRQSAGPGGVAGALDTLTSDKDESGSDDLESDVS
ncbi:MAG: sigma-70 family RNA polymerase sigma factor [Planctomycetaceae bacterium]|nr:sigma-70 family RNA polymerase sigma factor [Planctomycetaceae bacterium]